MPMLTRTATVIRKNRRRSSSKASNRRGSAPTVLQPSAPSPAPSSRQIGYGKQSYLTPQPSPSKSVTFSYDSECKLAVSPDTLSIHQVSRLFNIIIRYIHIVGTEIQSNCTVAGICFLKRRMKT